MEPPLDTLCTFETGGSGFGDSSGKTRYAIRQVLEQEWRKEELRLAEESRLARFGVSTLAPAAPASKLGAVLPDDELMKRTIARDFFGRPIAALAPEAQKTKDAEAKEKQGPSVWIAFHEGYSNAVRKPITLAEFMKDL